MLWLLVLGQSRRKEALSHLGLVWRGKASGARNLTRRAERANAHGLADSILQQVLTGKAECRQRRKEGGEGGLDQVSV